MRAFRHNALLVIALLITTAACSSAPKASIVRPGMAPAAAASGDDLVTSELQELITTMRQDLTLHRSRDRERMAAEGNRQPASRGNARTAATSALGGGISSRSIVMGPALMPVAGVRSSQLVDSWGAPRDGGKRRHRGIDIFAPKGTEIYSVADGVITFIGEQPLGGRCLWVSTEDGLAFYYAHLDRWAPGIYEGMEVKAGTVLGYVGNTGNARTTPAHLHLSIRDRDTSINPYTFLRHGRMAAVSQSGAASAGGAR